MRRFTVAVLCFVLSFAFVFTVVGYAQLSDVLSVRGSAEVEIPDGLYIVAAEPVAISNATAVSTQYHTPTNLDATISGTRNTSSVTYAITVINRTDYKYTYAGIDFDSSLDGYEGNSYIDAYRGITITTKENQTDTSATFNTYDSIEPRSIRTFYATYTYGSRVPKNQNLKTFVNFKFGVNVESVEAVVIDRMFAEFEEILNDTSEGGGYETLIDIIDNKYTGGGAEYQWKATYIGNVTGSLSEDTRLVNELFGGTLSITIDNVETNVTLLIKREDIDGDTSTGDSYEIGTGSNYISASGCEMTLYMTTDKLQDRYSDPVIYAASFTCNVYDDGTYGPWYMLGDMYVGTADIVGYQGGNTTGSFQTDTWLSTGRYTFKVNDNYSYTVTENKNIKTIIQALDSNANAELQALLNRANEILLEGKYAGDAVIQLRDAVNRASHCYKVNTDSTLTVKSTATRAQIVPIIKELTAILAAFEDV